MSKGLLIFAARLAAAFLTPFVALALAAGFLVGLLWWAFVAGMACVDPFVDTVTCDWEAP